MSGLTTKDILGYWASRINVALRNLSPLIKCLCAAIGSPLLFMASSKGTAMGGWVALVSSFVYIPAFFASALSWYALTMILMTKIDGGSYGVD
jgi:hypothetical protein